MIEKETKTSDVRSYPPEREAPRSREYRASTAPKEEPSMRNLHNWFTQPRTLYPVRINPGISISPPYTHCRCQTEDIIRSEKSSQNSLSCQSTRSVAVTVVFTRITLAGKTSRGLPRSISSLAVSRPPSYSAQSSRHLRVAKGAYIRPTV